MITDSSSMPIQVDKPDQVPSKNILAKHYSVEIPPTSTTVLSDDALPDDILALKDSEFLWDTGGVVASTPASAASGTNISSASLTKTGLFGGWRSSSSVDSGFTSWQGEEMRRIGDPEEIFVFCRLMQMVDSRYKADTLTCRAMRTHILQVNTHIQQYTDGHK